jgi:Tfp pilus assembly protein PilX
MRKFPKSSCDLRVRRKKGFALVLALSLMSLVFLLVVSLVSLVGTDLNLSELRKQKVIAQANARMGMMVALGEIQKHLGPDTRVTATADILDERVESGKTYARPKL